MEYYARVFPVSCIYFSMRDLLAELSFVTLTIHLCDGLNDQNLVKPRKKCFLPV